MSTFGTDFKKIFEGKIDQIYSGFYDNTQLNTLFKEALFLGIEKKYETMAEQRDYDALSSAIKVNKKFTLSGNQISIRPIAISNVQNSTTTITVTTSVPTGVVVGDQVKFSQISTFVTTPAINGNFFTILSTPTTTTFTFAVSVFTSGVYVPATGYIIDGLDVNGVSKLTIGDYMHLLALKARYVYPITVRDKQLKVTGATKAQPIVITVSTKNGNLRTGSLVTTSAIYGNGNANGTFYLKKVSDDKFALYRDDRFLIPASGNGVYTGGGVVSQVDYNYAVALFPSEKISKYNEGTTIRPVFERGDLAISVMPDNLVCDEVTIDYVQNNIQLIVVTNSTIDLSQYYPEEFLYYICDLAVEMFMIRVKDQESIQPNLLMTEKAK